jgi:hypothetical protein
MSSQPPWIRQPTSITLAQSVGTPGSHPTLHGYRPQRRALRLRRRAAVRPGNLRIHGCLSPVPKPGWHSSLQNSPSPVNSFLQVSHCAIVESSTTISLHSPWLKSPTHRRLRRVPVGPGTASAPVRRPIWIKRLDFDHLRRRNGRRGDPHLEHAVRVLRLHVGDIDASGSSKVRWNAPYGSSRRK